MNILTYINRMNQIYGDGQQEAAPVRYNTQQYLRPGFRGAGLVDHGPEGVRQGYAEKYLSNSEFAELYKKFPGGTDTEFADYLNGLKKQAKGGIDFDDSSVESRRKRLNIKSKAPPIYGASKTMASFKKEAKELGIDIKGLDDQTIKNKVRNRREDLIKQKKRLTDPEWAKKDAAAKKAWAERNPEKVKETLSKTRQKIYLEKGIPPPAQNAKEELWRSLFADAQKHQEGRRLKIVGNYDKYISRDQLLNAEILDTKTKKKITFKNLEKYINPKNTGKTYAEVIKPYTQKWFVNETPGLRNEINSKLIKNWTPGDKRNWFEIQHNAGRYTDPFDVSLSNKGVNLKESHVRSRFEKMWNASDNLSDKKKAFRFYKENLPNEILSKPSMVKRSRYFGTDIPLEEQLKNLKASGVELPKGTLKKAINAAKYVGRTATKVLPVLAPFGVGLGLYDMEKARAEGMTSPLELGTAYALGPEVARGYGDIKKRWKYWQDPSKDRAKPKVYRGIASLKNDLE